MWRLLGGVLAAALLAAAPAGADPVALRDAPRAQDLALAGDAVVLGRAAGDAVRVDALPLAGGPPRRLLSVRAPNAAFESEVEVAASPNLVVARVLLDRVNEFRIYSGPPSGPLVKRSTVEIATGTSWLPYALDVDADRVLVNEVRLARRPGFRARVLGPGSAVATVPWGGWLLDAALAGGRVAFFGSRERKINELLDHLFVLDLATGAVEAEAELRPEEDFEDGDLDLAPDGRAVAVLDDAMLTVAPGVPPARREGDFKAPRFSGDGVAVLRGGRLGTRRPVMLEPDGTSRALGFPSAALELMEADDRHVAWLANGCVLYARRDAAPPAQPPPGPCPRAEVALEQGDQIVRGRRLQIRVTCIHAPPGGCRGTALLGHRGRYGRGRFAVAAGRRRTIQLRLTARGLRHVRRLPPDGPIIDLTARVRDGRAPRALVVIQRVRR